MKTFIKPKLSKHTNVVKPKITPNMCGKVLTTPKLKPEYDATILFGPGEQLVTNINKHRDSNSGCMFMLQANHFLLFGMGEQEQLCLPHL